MTSLRDMNDVIRDHSYYKTLFTMPDDHYTENI